MTLSLGNVLNAGFEQVFILYSPQVYETGDIIDTMVYRMGLVQLQYSMAAAVGLFKSVVSLVLVSLSYWLAYRFAKYRIF
jgi:putative aldouronate transport system permease protein